MYKLTFFKNLYDTDTSSCLEFKSHLKLAEALYEMSKIPYPEKKAARLMSPAVYKDGEDITRLNANVDGWGSWAGIDIDKKFDDTSLSFIKRFLRERIGEDIFYLAYSTASSKESHPKFRVILFFDQIIPAEKIKQLWHAINQMIDEALDAQCKDLSRMYYVPGTYKDAFNFFFISRGKGLLNCAELIAKYPSVQQSTVPKSLMESLPPKIQDKIIDQRKKLRTKDNITWNSYEDCPFVNKKLINEYKSMSGIDGSGRYAMIYKIMASIAFIAVTKEYPITEYEIINLIMQLDMDTGARYQNRKLDTEAKNAIKYAYIKG